MVQLSRFGALVSTTRGRLAGVAVLSAACSGAPAAPHAADAPVVTASNSAAQPAQPPPGSAPTASSSPGCPERAAVKLEIWADAQVRPYFVSGATLLSDGKSVAVPHGSGFVQDGALTATPECDQRDVFAGFAGSFPTGAWTVRGGPALGDARVYRFNGTRWVLDSRHKGARVFLEPWHDGGLLLVAPEPPASPDTYKLRALASKPRPAPVPVPGQGCKLRVFDPSQLVTNTRGDAAVLGRLCGADPAARGIELWRAAGASEITQVPAGVSDPRLALAADGALFVAGSKQGKGYVARYEAKAWQELPPLPSAVTAAAVAKSALWAVVAPTPAVQPAACGNDSNVWRYDGTRWQSVPVPAEVGVATQVHAGEGDDVWVSAERALLRTQPAAAMVRWSRSAHCPQPITGAKPYTLRRVPWSQLSVKAHTNLVGPGCPHFLMVDSTTAPYSTRFNEVWVALRASPEWGDSARQAEANYDAVQHGEKVPYGSPAPFVTYELGRYYWGITADPVEDDELVSIDLRRMFPKILREVCASPYPIRVDSLTKNRAGAPPR